MKTIAIIPARGGSKRIPRKNIKKFCGKPIIQYSILAALECGMFDTVMVSTDDSEIAKMAKEYGAEVPFFRSEENSDDKATSIDALYEVLLQYAEKGEKYDYACFLYPTAPFVTAEKLKSAMKLLQDTKKDSIITIMPFSFPPQRGVKYDGDKIEWVEPQYMFTRTQDLPKMYHDCGQFYCLSVEKFMKSKKLVMENTGGFVIDEMEAQDIDTSADWKIAEMKYSLMMEKNK